MAKHGNIEATARPLTREERQAIGEAHFETSVFNVPGRTPEEQTGYRKHFGRQFAELTRPFGGR